ncbi:Vps52-domain-containing protein [Boletus edulis BED1]|uniref:Vps52-domain-containing protein n=1 Tax=Boletus edulis BED1 TaxID=1328754 RepID=A0AAD4C7V7_BOLED|nr:Vps52-domain-containing protein [Boletus edulis BED1]
MISPGGYDTQALDHAGDHGDISKPTFRSRAKEFIEFHDQVETGVRLLDSLESFLSTFQRDLSAVSGQISDLQERSTNIDNRLKSRRKIEKPLSSLISDLTIPPTLATTLLDTEVGEAWIPAVTDFERRLNALRARSRVKAARELVDVVEALRIVTATKLRAFFLALLNTIKNSVTTNMQVLQSSGFLKYRSLFGFLKRQAEPVAKEIQDSYISAARTYYETAFRRYIRSLGSLRSRVTEKFESIATVSAEDDGIRVDFERLTYAKLEGPAVILAYQADDKTYKEPLEAILRSLFLVLTDNATAEYSFVASFFFAGPLGPSPFAEEQEIVTPEPHDLRTPVPNPGVGEPQGLDRLAIMDKAERTELSALWKKIFDPALEYTKTFLNSVIESLPPAAPLLTMVRLTEAVTTEVQKRQCSPLETFFFTMRLQLWPVFQKVVSEHCDSLKKLSERPSGYFSKAPVTTDALVMNICKCYISLFQSLVLLTEQSEETMIFSNLFRLQQELNKLVLRHTEQITDPVAKATKQSSIYEVLLQGLIKGTHLTAHPKAQDELNFWTEKEERARRIIIAAGKRRQHAS